MISQLYCPYLVLLTLRTFFLPVRTFCCHGSILVKRPTCDLMRHHMALPASEAKKCSGVYSNKIICGKVWRSKEEFAQKLKQHESKWMLVVLVMAHFAVRCLIVSVNRCIK